MKKSVFDKIERLAMFTMSESQEKKDTCIGIYGKSLLYLIRASLEKEPRAEILGLQECVRRDDDLTALFGAPGSGSKGEVMWSKTAGGGPFSSTTSTTHGGLRQQRRDHGQPRPPRPRPGRPPVRVPRQRPTGHRRRRRALAHAGGGLRLHRVPAGDPVTRGRRGTTAGPLHRHRRLPGAIPALGLRGGRRGLEGRLRAGRLLRGPAHQQAGDARAHGRDDQGPRRVQPRRRRAGPAVLRARHHRRGLRPRRGRGVRWRHRPGRRGHLPGGLPGRQPAHRRRPRRDLGPAARRREPDHLLRLVPLRWQPARPHAGRAHRPRREGADRGALGPSRRRLPPEARQAAHRASGRRQQRARRVLRGVPTGRGGLGEQRPGRLHPDRRTPAPAGTGQLDQRGATSRR